MDMIGIQDNIFSIKQWFSALKIQLAIRNYHRIGISFGISAIFLISMILNSRTKLKILYFLPLFIFILMSIFNWLKTVNGCFFNMYFYWYLFKN